MKKEKIKEIVKKGYSKIVNENSCGCCNSKRNEQISKSIGYSNKEINIVPEANLGLGCGNPTAFGEIKEGDVVLDLGSGAGFDCFLASKKVGSSGKVIGVDILQEMIEKAEALAKKYEYKNIEFRLGDIEELPVNDNSINIIISNCVINLAPDKLKAFKEAFRVLKTGGKMFVSDIVLLEDLSEEQRNNEDLISGCVGGALMKEEYLNVIKRAGFEVKILSEDKDISKRQYQGIPLESLKVEGIKK